MKRVVLGLAVALLLATPPGGPGARDGSAEAAGCRRCAFGGLCLRDGALVECAPSRSVCVLTGGILGFNSMPPNVPVYWKLFADPRVWRSLGRLSGRIEVWSDYTVGVPAAPGLPAQCDTASQQGPLCWGREGAFTGRVRNDRLRGVARYPDGGACEFEATLAFGYGGAEANRFVCRDRAGRTLSEGALRVQLIRLTGCARRRR